MSIKLITEIMNSNLSDSAKTELAKALLNKVEPTPSKPIKVTPPKGTFYGSDYPIDLAPIVKYMGRFS